MAQVPCPFKHDSTFTISTNWVALPTGYFLLIRNSNKIGAIRITSVTKDTTIQPKVGEWIGSFTYESFFSEGKEDPLGKQPGSAKTGQLNFGRMVGWSFHTSHQLGNHVAFVGPWKINFLAERWASMSDQNFWKVIPGFEVAATSACDITQIDAYDSRLHWYVPNPNREKIEVPVDNLPHRNATPE